MLSLFRLREYVKGGLADDLVAGNAELNLGNAVDQEIAAIIHALDRDLRRDVLDDLAQEGVVAIAFLLELAMFGNILDRRDPAIVGQRLACGPECPPVRTQRYSVIDLVSSDILRDRSTGQSDGGVRRRPVARV